MKKYFGTDGVRDIANTGLITPEGAVSLGKTLAYYILERELPRKVVVGKDTRMSGDFLEDAISSGLSSMGIEVYKLGIVTTPGVAYLSRILDVGGGVVISASHNPYYDNGIKFFTNEGFKFPDNEEEYLEEILDNHVYNTKIPHYTEIRKIYKKDELIREYEEFLKGIYKGEGFPYKVIVDTANGATYKIAQDIFSDIGKFEFINCEPNGLNINFEAGATHLDGLIESVKEKGAYLGFAYDGDGDRLMVVSSSGKVIDGDALLYLFAKEFGEREIVVTMMSNIGLDISLKKRGIKVRRIPKVGDKYVVDEMKRKGVRIGGEQSGHIVFLDKETTGDGLFTSIMVMNLLSESKNEIETLLDGFLEFPQKLINIEVKDKTLFYKDSKVQDTIRDIEQEIEGKGLLVVRPSGTEPLIRIMAQAEDERHLDEIIERVKRIIEERLA